MQAETLGLQWTEPSLAGHARPSAALGELLDRFGVEPTAGQQREMASLDRLPDAHRANLTRVVDAFLAFHAATASAYEEVDVDDARASYVDELGPSAPGLPEANLAERVDLGPVLSARHVLLSALDGLRGAGFAAEPSATCRSVSVPPAFAIDPSGCNDTYTADVALQIDAGGSDRYRNNAGGSNLAQGSCLVAEPGVYASAALVDLGQGNDTYGDPTGPRACGANGGGALGAGFLLDGGGNDTYHADGTGTNGGGGLGVGFLLDRAGDDTYRATQAGTNGGGAAQPGVGFLLDVSGDDTYSATHGGTNGGGYFLGSGSLWDLAGNDTYRAGSFGTNGGAYGVGRLFLSNPPGALGLLFDGSGADRYQQADEGHASWDQTDVPKGFLGAQVDVPVTRWGADCAPHPPIRITEKEGPEGFVLGHDPETGEPIYRPGSGVVAGRGTPEDPYLVEGWCIRGSLAGQPAATEQAGLALEGTDAHVLVRGNVIDGWPGQGIRLEEAGNVTLAANTLEANGEGLDVRRSTAVNVTGNTVGNNTGDGIRIADSPATSVRKNILTRNSDRGLSIAGSARVTVAGNTISKGGSHGADIEASDRATVANNTVYAQEGDGLRLVGSDEATLIENAIADVGRREGLRWLGAGIHLEASKDGRLAGNLVENSTTNGVEAVDTEATTLVGNTIEGHRSQGVFLARTQGILLADNTVEDNRGDGVLVTDAQRTTLRDNRILADGIEVDGSNGTRIVQNTIEDSPRDGVRIVDATGSTIAGTTITDSAWKGIYVAVSADATLRDNELHRNGLDILLRRSTGATLEGNAMDGGMSVEGPTLPFHDHAVAESNTLDGDPIRYVRDRSDVRVPAPAGQVFLVNTTDARIEGLDISNTDWAGIQLAFTAGTTIQETTIRQNAGSGVRSIGASQPLVENNTIEENARQGVHLEDTEHPTVSHSTVSGNGRFGVVFDGVVGGLVADNAMANNVIGAAILGSEDTRVANNSFVGNDFGVVLLLAYGIVVDANTASRSEVGVLTQYTDEAKLANNTLTDNQDGVYLIGASDTVVTYNTLTDNENGLRVLDSEADARHNWWGHVSGPSGGVSDACTGAKADGDGDAILVEDHSPVCFDPWLSSSR